MMCYEDRKKEFLLGVVSRCLGIVIRRIWDLGFILKDEYNPNR